MIFEYNQQKQFMKSIDVVDFGNTALRCEYTAEGIEYYVIVKTIMGKTSILFIGPMISDFPDLLPDFEISYSKMDYNEKKICKAINTYINDPQKKIDEIAEVLPEEVYPVIPNVGEMFANLQ